MTDASGLLEERWLEVVSSIYSCAAAAAGSLGSSHRPWGWQASRTCLFLYMGVWTGRAREGEGERGQPYDVFSRRS